ncbi:MAG: PilZ domain-containing protein [Candidatus Omnitrophica bacterium]|nr:PilZ domain-containing protein [Candidatus Omnitrophota bacterium]
MRFKEKRKAQRLSIPLNVKYTWVQRKVVMHKTVAQDIGGGGMRIRVKTPLKKHDLLKSFLYFPMASGPVPVVSEVVWCRKKVNKSKVYFEVGLRHKIARKDMEKFVLLFCETMINHVISSMR